MPTRSENTIANILTSAASLFNSRCYADVTMGQIAETSRVTKGAVYHHFSSKEELYLRLLHTYLDGIKAMFQDAIAAGHNCRDRLTRLTRSFFELSPADRDLIKLVRRDNNIFGPESRSELIQAYQDSLPRLIENTIRDGIAAGEIAPSDPRLLSWHFVALVEVILSEYANKIFHNIDKKLEFILDQFFAGVTAKHAE